jgi:glutamine amidotransferase-like uncharacterized protein
MEMYARYNNSGTFERDNRNFNKVNIVATYSVVF